MSFRTFFCFNSFSLSFKVDQEKPATLTWKRKLNTKANTLTRFNLKLREIKHLVCMQFCTALCFAYNNELINLRHLQL